MLTREEVLSIEDYCSENKITHKARLEEQGIHFWDFYKAKKKYREEDSSAEKPGQFIQLSSGRCVPSKMPAARTTCSAEIMMQPSELLLSTHFSAAARRMMLMFAHGLKMS